MCRTRSLSEEDESVRCLIFYLVVQASLRRSSGTCAEEEAELVFNEGTNASVVRRSRQVGCCSQWKGHGMQSGVDMKMSDQGSGSLWYWFIGAEKRAACA